MQINKNSLSNLNKANNTKRGCIYCGRELTLANIQKHEKSCAYNPATGKIKQCPACNKMHVKAGITCSYSCSNVYFAKARNKPERYKNYRTICFKNHEKKCIVCGEDKIVEVHHLNENNKDNRPENLIPLCPTHHQYVHSRYKDVVIPVIEDFIKKQLGVG